MDVYVVSHTHWDREWYHGAGRFRQRLVALVDELLDARPEDRFPFLLDGQGIVLDDYLAVRPERARELAAALVDGWLEAGPWYVLADELIPGGESLVRNLLAGRAALARLKAEPPPVLYCPDSFGHPAALPALARGFGLPLVILWRGYGGRRWPAGDTARWQAPDGGDVVLYHLPPSGYEFGSNLPATPDAAARWWRAARDVLAPRATLGAALLPNGADHHALQEDADAALLAVARAAARDAKVRRSSLADFARAHAARAARADLPMVRGELRDSYGYTWTLQGTLATRAHQKRRARLAERLLLRDVEPWVALAPAGRATGVRAALAAAWRTLLACHPHDTLCGCSTDGVARAMEARLDDAFEQARALRDDALASLVGHDPVAARTRRAEWRPVLVARNAAARSRGGVAEVELLRFLADVPVGPGSAPAPGVEPPADAPVPTVDDGRVLVQPLSVRRRHHRVESPRHYPDDDLVQRVRAVAWLPEVPALGTRSFALGDDAAADAGPAGPPEPVRAGARALDNGRLRVVVDDDGRVAVEGPDGWRTSDLLGVEHVGDRGDTYTHSTVGTLRTDLRFRGLRLAAAGPLRGVLVLRWVLRVPAAHPGRRASRREVSIPLRVALSLDAGAPWLRIAVRGVNRARDHRLRLVLRTPAAGGVVLADAAFGPVERPPLVVPVEDVAAERPPATAPLQRWVARLGGAHGAALVSDGLAEYEARDDGTLLVTLVRAVGELSRNDLPERPGHAGWPVRTPAAQCRGPFRATFALLPCASDPAAALPLVEAAADDVLHPLRATTLRSALRLPPPTEGPSLDGEGLVVSAVKPADDGDGMVLRCVNVRDRHVEGRWVVPGGLAAAWRSELDERRGEPARLSHEGTVLDLAVPPRALVTVRVRPRERRGDA